MSKPKLSIAIGNYDRTRALVAGEARIDGTDPIYMLLAPEAEQHPGSPCRYIRHSPPPRISPWPGSPTLESYKI